ncbi:hypothetical protein GUJ93_ZPchr0008g13056 [Zizania palustris]|uniref:MADS-box domain-containing protein n=1 Tax=Zizania palustris TaxID=103762 RepID=A0A8J5RAC7_ZIZPA|nr:hypothetical protein GUJ93_ZPchr0008g13056 [Zizania palustris]
MPRRARRTGAAYVDNEREREITFFKRRNGLFKGASDLTILTGANVVLVIDDQTRGKFHTFGSPLVQPIVDAALADDMKAEGPFSDQEMRARLAPLETELSCLEGEAFRKKIKRDASRHRYKLAMEEAVEDASGVGKLFFDKPYNLSNDEMKVLHSSLTEIQKDVRVRLPPLHPHGNERPARTFHAPPPQGSPPTSLWSSRLLALQNRWLSFANQSPSIANPLPPPPAPAAWIPPELSPSPPAPAAWIPPELPPPPVAGSAWANLFPLRPPRFSSLQMDPPLLESQQVSGQHHTQLAPLPPMLQEQYQVSDQFPVMFPLPPPPPTPLHMTMQAHLPPPPPPEAYYDPAGQQPQDYQNYDFIFDNNAQLPQPLVAAGNDDIVAVVGDEDPFGNPQWPASPVYGGQMNFDGGAADEMGGAGAVGDYGVHDQADGMIWANDIDPATWY